MVLGSGLGPIVDDMVNKTVLEFNKILGWYNSSNKVLGHSDCFVLG